MTAPDQDRESGLREQLNVAITSVFIEHVDDWEHVKAHNFTDAIMPIVEAYYAYRERLAKEQQIKYLAHFDKSEIYEVVQDALRNNSQKGRG